MFCTRCGQQLPANAAFCSRCGQALVAPELSDEVPVGAVMAAVVPDESHTRTENGPQLAEPTHSQPDPALESASPRNSARKIAWRSLASGIAVGVVLAALGTWAVIQSKATPVAAPSEPVIMNVDSLPETVLGRARSDIEFKEIRPDQTQGLREQATAGMSKFMDAYGGDGIAMSYGIYASKQIDLTAVNGDLNPPIVQPPEVIEYMNGVGGPYSYVEIPGTPTTTCAYASKEFVQLSGRTPAQVIAEVAEGSPATGTLVCVRRDLNRNFGVKLQGTGISSAPPTQAAAEMAAAVDQVWMELVAK